VSGGIDSKRGSTRSRWVAWAGFAIAYLILAEGAEWLTDSASQFSTFWPAAGLYVGTLLLVERRRWPLFVVTAAALDVAVSIHVGRKPFLATMFALGDGAEALLAASLVLRVTKGRPRMWRLRDLLAVIFWGAVVAPLFPALVGAASTALTNDVSFPRSFVDWWSGDALGILVVTPFLLAWAPVRHTDRNLVRERALEFALLLATSVATSLVVFRQARDGALAQEYLVLPVFVWAALRFGPRGVTAAGLLLAVIGSWATAMASLEQGTTALAPNSLALHAYLGVAIATSLLLATEVAARSWTEQRLRLARHALDRGGEAFLIADPRGMVVLASEAARRLLGDDGHRLVGRHLGEFDPSLAGPAWAARWAELRVAGTARYETTLHDEHGRHPPGDVNLAFIPHEDGEFLSWSARDLSERQRAEEEQRLAAVGTLAAGVAHEINNPLTYVTSNLAFVEETLSQLQGLHPDVPDAQAAVAEATLGARRVRDIVRDLRFVARPPDGRRTEIDPVHEIRSAITLAQAEISRRARLDVRLEPCPHVLAGQGQVGQVMLHLLVSAAQAIPPGATAAHQVRVAAGTDPAGWTSITVADSGPRPAASGAVARTAAGGGGLGLTACQGVVTSLGGSLEIRGEDGRGTSVHVRLPPVQPEALDAPAVT
jgi:PAS domain S-box-containing protein